MAGPHLAEWQGTCSALSLSYELRTSSWPAAGHKKPNVTVPSGQVGSLWVLAPRGPKCRGEQAPGLGPGPGPVARPRGQEAADGPAPH